MRSVRNPVDSDTLPASTASLDRTPNAPRSGSSSAAPPPKVSSETPRRRTQVTEVEGSSSTTSPSWITAVIAECPLPTTTTRLPAHAEACESVGGT
jgi:hypothetical protein